MSERIECVLKWPCPIRGHIPIDVGELEKTSLNPEHLENLEATQECGEN